MWYTHLALLRALSKLFLRSPAGSRPMEVSQRDLAILAWSTALGSCETLLTRVTKTLAKDKYNSGGQDSWKDELKVFLGQKSSPHFTAKADTDHWDWDTIGQLWQKADFLQRVLLPATKLQSHAPDASRLSDLAHGLYQCRLFLAKLESPSLSTALTSLKHLEELLALVGKHLIPTSLVLLENEYKTVMNDVKTSLKMVEGSSSDSGAVTATLTARELRWLLLHLSLQELNTSLKQHIRDAIEDGRLPDPASLKKKGTPKTIYDVVSLCQYLSACSIHSPKEDVAHLLDRKITKLDQTLKLIVGARHQLHHADADTQQWIEQNLQRVMEACAALLQGFRGESMACEASVVNLRENFMLRLSEMKTSNAAADIKCYTVTISKGTPDNTVSDCSCLQPVQLSQGSLSLASALPC